MAGWGPLRQAKPARSCHYEPQWRCAPAEPRAEGRDPTFRLVGHQCGNRSGTLRCSEVCPAYYYQWSISAVFLLTISLPTPSPQTTIFLIRVVLAQSYTISSPRSPDDPPTHPEPTRSMVLYQTGRTHASGEKFPGHTVNSLWRGPEAGGSRGDGRWAIKAIVRVPTHEKVRPSTHEG